MTAEQFISLLKEAGVSEAEAQKAAGKASSLRQQTEYDELNRQTEALKASYAAAKTYQDWYAKYENEIKGQAVSLAKYQERYGALDGQTQTQQQSPIQQSSGLSKDEIRALIAEEAKSKFSEVLTPYSNRWSDILKSNAEILSRHMKNGRKTELNSDAMSKIAEIADKTYGGNLVQAYEEWDKPEAVAAATASTEAEIKRRVDEEVAKRQTQNFFPGDMDGTARASSGGITKRAAENQEYDRSKVIQSAITGRLN